MELEPKKPRLFIKNSNVWKTSHIWLYLLFSDYFQYISLHFSSGLTGLWIIYISFHVCLVLCWMSSIQHMSNKDWCWIHTETCVQLSFYFLTKTILWKKIRFICSSNMKYFSTQWYQILPLPFRVFKYHLRQFYLFLCLCTWLLLFTGCRKCDLYSSQRPREELDPD